MRRIWTVAAVLIAVMAVGALVACEANSTKDALRSAASVAVSTAAAQEKGCSILGSWATDATKAPGEGGSPVQWIGTITGQSSASGTIAVDVPVWPQSPQFSWVAKVTLRGAWKRTGGNTFAFTQEGWLPGPDGKPVSFAKNVGTELLSDDCNTMTVVSTITVYDAVTGEFIVTQPIEPPMVAYRIMVEGE